ncbi:hypothetical protein DFH09DRAFT_1328308 [Mycena vulgaris]|nr:hypothetical protein DFH09DRAFT_1328308 [Mycena vulgaris]
MYTPALDVARELAALWIVLVVLLAVLDDPGDARGAQALVFAPRHAINAQPAFKFWLSRSREVVFALPAHVNFGFGLPASAATAPSTRRAAVFSLWICCSREQARAEPAFVPPSGQQHAIDTPPRAPTLWICSPRKRQYTSRVIFIPLLTSCVQFAFPPAAIASSRHQCAMNAPANI